MLFLKRLLQSQKRRFEKGAKLERLYPLYEALDTFLFSTGDTTQGPTHVRDGADMKRVMGMVVVALIPCMFMAMYNTGLQTHLAVLGGADPLPGWRTDLFEWLGFGFKTMGFWGRCIYGAMWFIPVYIVTLAAGGLAEVVFALVRKHEINEGFLVTSALFPLILPATIPLWQVALGILFGVVIGKEIFGGVGMNIWNPALMGRAFLYFGYPAQISGNDIWIAAQTGPDVYSGATWMVTAKEHGIEGILNGVEGLTNTTLTWWDAFIGTIPGSMGETSTLFCLLGAIFLIVTKIASWRIMLGMLIGSGVVMGGLNLMATPDGNPALLVPFYWYWILGSFAFATVFMATDPVTAPYTNKGRFIYGLLIGAFGMVINMFNPAYPGTWMLAILFMNTWSPLIDYFIVKANIKRRMTLNGA